MNKSTGKWFRTAFVWTAVLSLVADSSAAARFAGRKQCACAAKGKSKGQGKGQVGDLHSPPAFHVPMHTSPSDQHVPTPPAPMVPVPDAVERAPQEPANQTETPPSETPLAAPESGPSEASTPAEPAEAEPNPLDNLFDEPEAGEAEPNLTPAEAPSAPEPNPLEGLFDDTNDADVPVPPAPEEDDPLEGLFGDPGSAAAALPELREVFTATRLTTTSQPETRPQKKRLDVRKWTDESGHFGVEGRLVQIIGEKIRIRKTSQRTCTILVSQLSTDDRAYVTQVRSRIEGGENLQLAMD